MIKLKNSFSPPARGGDEGEEGESTIIEINLNSHRSVPMNRDTPPHKREGDNS
jgi:hypothetical protein